PSFFIRCSAPGRESFRSWMLGVERFLRTSAFPSFPVGFHHSLITFYSQTDYDYEHEHDHEFAYSCFVIPSSFVIRASSFSRLLTSHQSPFSFSPLRSSIASCQNRSDKRRDAHNRLWKEDPRTPAVRFKKVRECIRC